MKVKNKVIVVTGGGNGLGRALVLHLLDLGAKVVAVDINDEAHTETAKLAADKSADLSCHNLNITEREKVHAFPEQVIAAHVNVDGIINNAGIIQPFIRVNELDYKQIERVMNINLARFTWSKPFCPIC